MKYSKYEIFDKKLTKLFIQNFRRTTVIFFCSKLIFFNIFADFRSAKIFAAGPTTAFKYVVVKGTRTLTASSANRGNVSK